MTFERTVWLLQSSSELAEVPSKSNQRSALFTIAAQTTSPNTKVTYGKIVAIQATIVKGDIVAILHTKTATIVMNIGLFCTI